MSIYVGHQHFCISRFCGVFRDRRGRFTLYLSDSQVWSQTKLQQSKRDEGPSSAQNIQNFGGNMPKSLGRLFVIMFLEETKPLREEKFFLNKKIFPELFLEKKENFFFLARKKHFV